MRVTVAIALPHRQEVLEVELPEASTLAAALAHPRVAPLISGMPQDGLRFGVWSRVRSLQTPLREGDRVEVYRPLHADPKELRRRRARLKPSPGSRSGP